MNLKESKFPIYTLQTTAWFEDNNCNSETHLLDGSGGRKIPLNFLDVNFKDL